MKRFKKWLFPILTCLIVAGAAVLPPYLSQLRDAGQFGQIHVEGLAADALPVREPLDLLGRLKLYARWHDPLEAIPSFQTPAMEEMDSELAQQALEELARAGVIPEHLLENALEQSDVNRILLWDPIDGIGRQEPVEFWRVTAAFGNGSVWMHLDSESGLPLCLGLYDPNMARWLHYKEPDTLPNLAGCYFDLLGLEARLVETDPISDAAPWSRKFLIEGTDLCYHVSFNATTLAIDLEQDGADLLDGADANGT